MKSITLTKNKQKRIHISDLNIIIIGNPLLPLFASIFTASLAANALFFLTPLIFARSTEHIEVYGISMSLFIVSSFISSMIGGVLADIYTRKTVILDSLSFMYDYKGLWFDRLCNDFPTHRLLWKFR